MSHKAELKMSLTNKDILMKALTQMGLTFQEAKEGEKLMANSRYGVNEQVEIKLLKDAKGRDISQVGFRKNSDGTLEAVGDFYDLNGAVTKDGERLNENCFKGTVSKRYKYLTVIQEMEKMGYATEAPTNWNTEEVNFSCTKMY